MLLMFYVSNQGYLYRVFTHVTLSMAAVATRHNGINACFIEIRDGSLYNCNKENQDSKVRFYTQDYHQKMF